MSWVKTGEVQARYSPNSWELPKLGFGVNYFFLSKQTQGVKKRVSGVKLTSGRPKGGSKDQRPKEKKM